MTISVSDADVVLYTDGLVEGPTADLDRRLADLVEAVCTGPQGPGAICDHVLGSLVPGRDRLDDVAVLVASLGRLLSRPFGGPGPVRPARGWVGWPAGNDLHEGRRSQ